MLSGRCAHSASASYSQSVQLTFLVHLRAYTQRDTHRGTAITRIWAYPTPARRTERVQDGAEHVAHAERVLEAVRVHVADLQRLQPVREHAVRAARLRSRVRLPHDVLHLRARTRASGCQSRPGGAQARGQAPRPQRLHARQGLVPAPDAWQAPDSGTSVSSTQQAPPPTTRCHAGQPCSGRARPRCAAAAPACP